MLTQPFQSAIRQLSNKAGGHTLEITGSNPVHPTKKTGKFSNLPVFAFTGFCLTKTSQI